MVIISVMEKKNISKYRLAKESGVSYKTISNICSGKTKIEKCSAETIYKIARELDVTMELLLDPTLAERVDFTVFKSGVGHALKRMGDTEFIKDVIIKDKVQMYFRREWWPECLYMLAMLDYLSRINGIPYVEDYNYIRQYKLEKLLFPKDIVLLASVMKDNSYYEKALEEAIPEFLRFNIVEADIRNVG